MTPHSHETLVDGCYRCELRRAKIAAIEAEDHEDAWAAWVEYRDAWGHGHRELSRLDFTAGFLRGRQT